MIRTIIDVDWLEPVTEAIPLLGEDLERIIEAESDVERGRHHLLNDAGVGGGAEERNIVAAPVVFPLGRVLSRLQPPPLTHGDDLLPGPLVTRLTQEPLPGQAQRTRVGGGTVHETWNKLKA